MFSNFTDSSPKAQPKYIKGGKRYGRRSLPEFRAAVEDFAEVTVIEPLGEEARPPHIAPGGCEEVSGTGAALCFWGLLRFLPPRALLLPSLSRFLTSLPSVLPKPLSRLGLLCPFAISSLNNFSF